MEAGPDEIRSLRRGLGDLAAISALPTVWASFDALGVADSLAGTLQDMLDLHFAYVLLSEQYGQRQHEVIFTREGALSPERVREAREHLRPVGAERLVAAGAVRGQPTGQGECTAVCHSTGQSG